MTRSALAVYESLDALAAQLAPPVTPDDLFAVMRWSGGADTAASRARRIRVRKALPEEWQAEFEVTYRDVVAGPPGGPTPAGRQALLRWRYDGSRYAPSA